MQKTWKIRLVVAMLVGLFGSYLVWPTITYFSLSEDQLLQVKKSKDAFRQFIPEWVSESHIVPGLDLQGGIHMVLGVDLEKAISDKTGRITDRLRTELKEKKIATEKVLHLIDEDKGDRIEVIFKDDTGVDKYNNELADLFTDLTVLSEESERMLFRLHPNLALIIRRDAVDQTINTIRNRVDSMGVTEPSITKRGDDQVQIQLPGYSDPEEAKSLIGRTAQLEFLMCDDDTTFLSQLTDLPENVELQNSGYQGPGGDSGKDIFLSFPKDSLETVKTYLRGKRPPGRVIKYGNIDKKTLRTYTLISKVELTGDDLVDAQVAMGSAESPRPFVSMTFSPAGARIFDELTARSIGKRMAIVLEDLVDSAPVIQTRISGGSASITMGGARTREEMLKDANQLSLVLKAGALPAPVTFREERSVGPSLGADSVQQGKMAFSLGGILVILFMLIYYKMAGIISVIGVLFNLLFVAATLSWLGGTVTLPGLAGLLLTVGMAVDANIIINERIREELLAGKTPRSAVAAGYDAAFSAIIDANFTTFIAGMVLWQYGSGPVQNFATTLLIGTVSSVITAIFITRIFFDMVTAKGPQKLSI
jgi:preprotein translocase subunit SecD